MVVRKIFCVTLLPSFIGKTEATLEGAEDGIVAKEPVDVCGFGAGLFAGRLAAVAFDNALYDRVQEPDECGPFPPALKRI